MKDLNSQIIYSIYVRAHSASGKFSGVQADLDRIKDLGTDIIWLMPIHPIGQLNKKGTLGCPYSISNYRELNPEYGSESDLVSLLNKAHELGMKVIIDVVYHHTAHDSNLIDEKPHWYRQGPDGKPETSVPDWSDIIDLNHPNAELESYLIESLRKWVRLGIDGFRCDVASLVPLKFWLQAKNELAAENQDLIWLAESVNPDFVAERRLQGRIAHSDAELYQAFQILYDYDIFHMFQKVLSGKMPLSRYLELLALQDAIYPADYCKLRFVENHDQTRIMKAAASKNQALAWTSFQAFNKGPFMIYGGQESAALHTPSLFEKEDVEWGNYELTEFLKSLSALKKSPIACQGKFILLAESPCLQAAWLHQSGKCLLGVFNVMERQGICEVPLADGDYIDSLSQRRVQIQSGQMQIPEKACVVESESGKQLISYIPEFWRKT